MPVNAMTMPHLSQHSITRSSRIEPPGSAIYFPFAALCSFDVVAEWEERVRAERYAVYRSEIFFISPSVSGSGREVKYFCQLPSAQTSSSFC